jgi:hypothetical protein
VIAASSIPCSGNRGVAGVRASTPARNSSTHPEYTEGNRARQQERDARRRERVLAKMDVSTRDAAVPSGTYRLDPVAGGGLAKMDAWTVEITVLSTT